MVLYTNTTKLSSQTENAGELPLKFTYDIIT